MPGGSIKDCLATVGVGTKDLAAAGTLSEEWSLLKKAYFKKILVVHPDKGGDAAVFRDVQATFEVLRKIFEEGAIKSFSASLDLTTSDAYRGLRDDLKTSSMPSWDYYKEAAKEVAATYKVELARSNRSRCQARGARRRCSAEQPFIEKGSIRVGFKLESGGYGLWVHLDCWRVPSKIWLGLPDPAKTRGQARFETALLRMNEVSLSGVSALGKADRRKLISYVMDKAHWTFGGAADRVKRKAATAGGSSAARESVGDDAASSRSLVALAGKQKQSFVIPIPGKDGAPRGSLVGQTFVITGTFPEVGGGEGLQLGKDRVKKMITSFGGKVASSVSGKTDVLVVGKDPGFSKVSKARKNPSTCVLSLHDIKLGLERGSLEDAKAKRPMLVRSFSKGYSQRRGGPNGLARSASEAELAIASGTAAPALQSTKRPASAPRRGLKIRKNR